MHVDLFSVVGIVGSLLAFFASIYLAVLRYALSQKEKEIDRRFDDGKEAATTSTKECDVELRKLSDRLSEQEKLSIRQGGQIDLVQNNHEALTRDLDEIKHNMITKAEFEPRMTNLERTLNQILAELRGGRGSYGHMPAVSPKPR